MKNYRILTVLVIALLLTTSAIWAQDDESASVPGSIGLELVVDGLSAPIDLEQPDDDSNRLFVADQTGLIHVVNSNGELLETPFLDLRDQMVELSEGYDERGLLGFAFHPDFANNGRFFVYYSAPLSDDAPSEWNHTSVLSEFAVSSDDNNVADLESERVLLTIDQPQLNHNGGDITFGADNYLYVPLGDGGAADDVAVGHTEGLGNGQDLSKLLGKMLRINVDGDMPYAIPEDNPFIGESNVGHEIWAYGFRNPWRISFDEEYGWFVADLGQNVWEEVNLVQSGGNYGWNIMEGAHCFSTDTPDYNPLHCERTLENGDQLQPPIIEYSHQIGISIIGGYVYRGDTMSSGLQGKYVFGDWSTSFSTAESRIMVASPPPNDVDSKMWRIQTFQIANTDANTFDEYILSFGQDQSGELYVLTSATAGPAGDTGKVWRIVPTDSVASTS